MSKLTTFMAVLIVGALVVHAQTTLPAGIVVDRAALEIRANQEFDSENYENALPMLKKLAEMSKDRPDMLAAIQEKVRVCETNIASKGPAKPVSLSANRKPHAAPQPGQTLEMPIKELGNFDYSADKGGGIPDDVLKLSGNKIRLRGFMIPMDQASNITQFALVPDLFSCCFGQPPQVQHVVIANCPKGKAVGYYPDEIMVEGTLKVAEKKDEGFIVSIFEVQVTSVKPAPK